MSIFFTHVHTHANTHMYACMHVQTCMSTSHISILLIKSTVNWTHQNGHSNMQLDYGLLGLPVKGLRLIVYIVVANVHEGSMLCKHWPMLHIHWFVDCTEIVPETGLMAYERDSTRDYSTLHFKMGLVLVNLADVSYHSTQTWHTEMTAERTLPFRHRQLTPKEWGERLHLHCNIAQLRMMECSLLHDEPYIKGNNCALF